MPFPAAALTIPLHLRSVQTSATDRRLGAFADELPRSFLRGGVTAASLAAGQLALGERDFERIALRSLSGALLTELTSWALRWANQWNGNDDRMILATMLTYGPRVAEEWAVKLALVRHYEALAAAQAAAQAAPPPR